MAAAPGRGTPLWPGARYTREDRDRAIERGMHFLYDKFATRPKYFASYSTDLLSAFDNIQATSLDPHLRSMAMRMGRERARAWRRRYPSLPPNAGVGTVADMVYGNDAAEGLGVPDPRMRAQLTAAAAHFKASDFFPWDPAREPPPRDLPIPCRACGKENARGAVICAKCGAKLAMHSAYDLYQDALIASYTGDSTGIPLGAHYRDVLKWLPRMRPYPQWSADSQSEYDAAVYAITHVIYTYDSYSRYRVSRECFPDEFEYLTANLQRAAADHDAETMGEFLDTLRAFGLDFSDPLIRAGFDYLLSSQNRDGSWGDPKDPDGYNRYHSTWTAIDGLRDYRWSEVKPCPAR